MLLPRALLALVLLLCASVAPAGAATPVPIQFTRFASAAAFGAGSFSGTVVDGERLVLSPGEISGTWESPLVQPTFGFSRLVASWNADSPADSLLRIAARITTDAGETSGWYTLGVWSTESRTSINNQADALARVDTDTLAARSRPFASYTLRVELERSSAEGTSPTVRLVGAEVADFEYTNGQPLSTPIDTDPVELAVPPLSQEIHAREYPQWGGGGEAWCSPTSTQMVIEFWGRGPTAEELAWVDPSYADPSVDFAARATYDPAYRGTGNWPFNTAYAARYGLNAFVTQLRSLAEAERFVRSGIPLVASIASRPGELNGFLFAGGTNGHLVVIVGFDAFGNPMVNDPAAWTNASVRRVYDRAQFERVWLRGSAGTVYVIHPPEVPLPPPPEDATPNW